MRREGQKRNERKKKKRKERRKKEEGRRKGKKNLSLKKDQILLEASPSLLDSLDKLICIDCCHGYRMKHGVYAMLQSAVCRPIQAGTWPKRWTPDPCLLHLPPINTLHEGVIRIMIRRLFGKAACNISVAAPLLSIPSRKQQLKHSTDNLSVRLHCRQQ